MARFTPKTEEQIQDERLLPDGVYKFRVVGAEDKRSQSGNDMISLKLKTIYNNAERIVFCNLLFHAMLHITKHFCDGTDQQSKYEMGELNARDCINQEIFGIVAKATSQKGELQNKIIDFLTPEVAMKESKINGAPIDKSNDFINDEIPF